MKYIGVEVYHKVAGSGKRYIFVFPEDFVHSAVADSVLTTCRVQWPGNKWSHKVTSAGFCSVSSSGVEFDPVRRSETLNLGPLERDKPDFIGADYSFNQIS